MLSVLAELRTRADRGQHPRRPRRCPGPRSHRRPPAQTHRRPGRTCPAALRRRHQDRPADRRPVRRPPHHRLRPPRQDHHRQTPGGGRQQDRAAVITLDLDGRDPDAPARTETGHDGVPRCGPPLSADQGAHRLGRVKVREAIKIVEADGWRLDRVRGSHRQYVHATKPGVVTIPGKLSDDLATGTAHSIMRQAGLGRRNA